MAPTTWRNTKGCSLKWFLWFNHKCDLKGSDVAAFTTPPFVTCTAHLDHIFSEADLEDPLKWPELPPIWLWFSGLWLMKGRPFWIVSGGRPGPNTNCVFSCQPRNVQKHLFDRKLSNLISWGYKKGGWTAVCAFAAANGWCARNQIKKRRIISESSHHCNGIPARLLRCHALRSSGKPPWYVLCVGEFYHENIWNKRASCAICPGQVRVRTSNTRAMQHIKRPTDLPKPCFFWGRHYARNICPRRLGVLIS